MDRLPLEAKRMIVEQVATHRRKTRFDIYKTDPERLRLFGADAEPSARGFNALLSVSSSWHETVLDYICSTEVRIHSIGELMAFFESILNRPELLLRVKHIKIITSSKVFYHRRLFIEPKVIRDHIDLLPAYDQRAWLDYCSTRHPYLAYILLVTHACQNLQRLTIEHTSHIDSTSIAVSPNNLPLARLVHLLSTDVSQSNNISHQDPSFFEYLYRRCAEARDEGFCTFTPVLVLYDSMVTKFFAHASELSMVISNSDANGLEHMMAAHPNLTKLKVLVRDRVEGVPHDLSPPPRRRSYSMHRFGSILNHGSKIESLELIMAEGEISFLPRLYYFTRMGHLLDMTALTELSITAQLFGTPAPDLDEALPLSLVKLKLHTYYSIHHDLYPGSIRHIEPNLLILMTNPQRHALIEIVTHFDITDQTGVMRSGWVRARTEFFGDGRCREFYRRADPDEKETATALSLGSVRSAIEPLSEENNDRPNETC